MKHQVVLILLSFISLSAFGDSASNFNGPEDGLTSCSALYTVQSEKLRESGDTRGAHQAAEYAALFFAAATTCSSRDRAESLMNTATALAKQYPETVDKCSAMATAMRRCDPTKDRLPKCVLESCAR